MTIYLAADHAGFLAKEKLKASLTEAGHAIVDCGAYTLDPEDDYPEYISACARQVAEAPGPGVIGIIFGASGQGEAMVANRVPGVRAAVYYGPAREMQTDASGNTLSLLASVRAHNDANVLSLGARFLSGEEIERAVAEFISTPFSEAPRHRRRIEEF